MKILVAALVISYGSCALGQSKYPPLTNVISFQDLKQYAVSREFDWINLDGEKEKIKFLEMRIPVDDQMKRLTQSYLHANYGIDSIWVRPRVIIFHAMGDGDLKTSLEISSFLNNEIPADWGELHHAGKLPNGAHFIVDRDGTIMCLTPPVDGGGAASYKKGHHWMVRRHQDANPVAIGVENVTPAGDWTSLTDAQLASNARLARWLIGLENNRIDYLMSHHQFNDDVSYDQFLKAFKLKNLQKQFRTKGRKDVGNANLQRIVDDVRRCGYKVHTFSELD